MKLDEWYDYYFEHGGRCPTCDHLLTMHYGCTNFECQECRDHMEKDVIFSKRVVGAKRKKDREIKEYNNLKQRIRERKNIDKCKEKKYADVEHSRFSQ